MIVRRTFVVLTALVVLALAALVPAAASAGGRPAASYYTPQQLQAMSERYAAKAALGYLTPQQRKTLAAAWTAQARLIRNGSQSDSLDWGDFGIGAAGMLGLVLLVGGSVLVVRLSRRTPRTPAVRARFGT